jgi:hypothetical protein
VRALINSSNDKYFFIGLSLTREKLSEYLNSHEYGIPVYTDLSNDFKTSYKLAGTPQTIVMSTDGKVIKSWTGAYSGPLKTEIEEYFNVTLPGLAEVNQ